MNTLSLILFAHVVGMLGLFATLALEGVSVAHNAQELAMPRLYRASLILLVLSGAYLSRGLVQGSAASVSELGWLVVSLPAVAVIGAAEVLSRGVRRRSYTIRTALGLGVVFLMIVKPRLDLSIAIVFFTAIAAMLSTTVKSRRGLVVRTAVDR